MWLKVETSKKIIVGLRAKRLTTSKVDDSGPMDEYPPMDSIVLYAIRSYMPPVKVKEDDNWRLPSTCCAFLMLWLAIAPLKVIISSKQYTWLGLIRAEGLTTTKEGCNGLAQ